MWQTAQIACDATSSLLAMLRPAMSTHQASVALHSMCAGEQGAMHQARHVCRYVQDMRPGSTASFQLMTTYPTKILSDHSITLRDADVANCVLTQKPA